LHVDLYRTGEPAVLSIWKLKINLLLCGDTTKGTRGDKPMQGWGRIKTKLPLFFRISNLAGILSWSSKKIHLMTNKKDY